MRDVDLAYLAGVIDADGYVTATRSERKGRLYFGAQVGITGSRRQPHDLASSIFGNRVTAHRPTSNPKHLTQFHWQVGGAAASPIIQALLPYLRIKRDRALLVLDFQAELDEAREHRPEGGVPWLPVGHDRTATFSQRVDEIRAAGRELDGRGWDEYPS